MDITPPPPPRKGCLVLEAQELMPPDRTPWRRERGHLPSVPPQASGVWLLVLLAGGHWGCPGKKEALDLCGIFYGRQV